MYSLITVSFEISLDQMYCLSHKTHDSEGEVDPGILNRLQKMIHLQSLVKYIEIFQRSGKTPLKFRKSGRYFVPFPFPSAQC